MHPCAPVAFPGPAQRRQALTQEGATWQVPWISCGTQQPNSLTQGHAWANLYTNAPVR
jgi:hypothetical protein